jgi:tetratricopeptide (TPR) repeat protein
VSVLLLTLFWLPLAPGAHAIQDTERLRRAARSFREADRLKTDHRLVQAAQKLRHSAQAAPWHLNLLPIPQVPFPLSKWAKSGISDARDQVSQGGSPHDWLSLGFWLDFAGAKKEAISAYEQVSKAAFWPGDLPAVHVAMIRKGLAHLSVGDVAPGRRAFELASELKPGSAQALIGLAMCSEEDEAQTYLERAERATPLLEIYYFHGRMLLDCGRPGEAVQPLSKLTHRLPQYARGRMLFAIALYRTGRLVAAAEQALGAQRQFPDLFDAQYTPLDMLTRAAEQNPHNRSAWRYLARIASHYGDLNLALTAWSHLKQHRQLTPDDQIHIGMLLLDHERPGDAVPYFEAALHTGNPSAQAGQNGLDLARRRIRGR